MKFNPAQEEFVKDMSPFPCFLGGFGSGKTSAGIARIMRFKRAHPLQDCCYYLPTYGLVDDIAFQRFPAMLDRLDIPYKLNKQSATITFDGAGRILFRSFDREDRIVGYEVATSIVDELDTVPTDKARNVWNKIIGRNRQKAYTRSGLVIPNTCAVTTTPEGFRFVYEKWGKNPAPGYTLHRCKTMDNAHNLPEGYIDNLRATYPPNLLMAYLEGEFVNLSAGSVYAEFDRLLNASNESIQSGEPLHIGMDFNVNNMSAVVFVLRDGNPHAVAEFEQIRDTPTMIDAIKNRYQGHSITVYPDASGGSHKSVNASLSDITLLRGAGFNVLAPNKNPAIKDRVLSVNQLIHNQGVRRLFVNFSTCPTFVECLEQQAYDKNGMPDKSSGHDHMTDAAGYFLSYKFGIGRGPASFAQIVGL